MKLWAGRFQKETNDVVNDFNSSIQFDGRLYREDITGSIAHATMLGKQGIIEEHEAEKIVAGLKEILKEVEAGELDVFNPEYEDIHMNVEVALTQRIGDTGKRLHTARSRNDQVALDMRMYVKKEICEIMELAIAFEKELVAKSKRKSRHSYAGLHPFAARTADHIRSLYDGICTDAAPRYFPSGRLL